MLDLTAAQDRRVQYGAHIPLCWAADSSVIFFPAADHGTRHVYCVEPRAQGAITQVTHGPRQLTHFHVSSLAAAAAAAPDAMVVVAAMKDECAPAQLVRFDFSSVGGGADSGSGEQGKDVRLTDHNAAVRATVATARAESFAYQTHDGQTLEGWLYRPLPQTPQQPAAAAPMNEAETAEKWPTILQVHGGPHGMHGYLFNAQVQALAGAGYAVLCLNPRGSNGYGQAFSSGCVNDWGGGDYKDLMAGLDAAIASPSWDIDPQRLGVCGGSYGGK